MTSANPEASAGSSLVLKRPRRRRSRCCAELWASAGCVRHRALCSVAQRLRVPRCRGGFSRPAGRVQVSKASGSRREARGPGGERAGVWRAACSLFTPRPWNRPCSDPRSPGPLRSTVCFDGVRLDWDSRSRVTARNKDPAFPVSSSLDSVLNFVKTGERCVGGTPTWTSAQAAD